MRTNRNDVAEALRSIIHNDQSYLEVVWGIDEFNKKFEVTPNPDLYAKLICEEVSEWQEELLTNGYGPNLLKETVDVIYVLEGLLAANPDDDLDISEKLDERLLIAIEIIECIIAPFIELYFTQTQIMQGFFEVQRSNLSKLGRDGKPIYREDRKILKGPDYSEANVAPFIRDKYDFINLIKI